MRVLSLQSQVLHGHVGNSAALLPLAVQGIELWAAPAAILAHHPGHGPPAALIVAPEAAEAWAGALARLPEWHALPGLLTGWLGRAGMAEAAKRIVGTWRAANPAGLYLCDPVLGDDGGLYVPADLAEAIGRDLLPLADIITPNLFELGYLVGWKIATVADAIRAADELRRRMRPDGLKLAVVTSLPPRAGKVEALAVNDQGAWLCEMPDLGQGNPMQVPKGAGDTFAALLLARLLRGKSAKKALAFAMGGVYAALEAAVKAGRTEMRQIGVIEEFRRPRYEPMIHKLRGAT